MNKTFFKKQLLYKNNKKPSLYLISPEKFKLYDFYQELEKVFFTNATRATSENDDRDGNGKAQMDEDVTDPPSNEAEQQPDPLSRFQLA